MARPSPYFFSRTSCGHSHEWLCHNAHVAIISFAPVCKCFIWNLLPSNAAVRHVYDGRVGARGLFIPGINAWAFRLFGKADSTVGARFFKCAKTPRFLDIAASCA